MARTINESGIELIKHFESLRLKAYQDSVDVWTIGWGHTGLTHKDGTVHEGREITEDEAVVLLKRDLKTFEETVERCVDININDNQFAALVSFAFNLGGTNLRRSTLLKKLNAEQHFNASKEFKKWSKAGGKRLGGLVRRRISERNLFCSFPEAIVETLPNDWKEKYKDL